MSETDERMNAFPPVPKSEWLKKVETDLKGASPDRLRSQTPGGMKVEPLYTAEDADLDGGRGLPGVAPYVRGASPTGGWLIRQEYDDPRPDVCKQQIAEDVARGVEAVWLRAGPRHGCRVLTVDQLEDVLSSVDPGTTSIVLDGGADALAVAAGWLAAARRRGVEPSTLRGGFAFDPIGLLASGGHIQGGLRARLAELADLGAWCAEHAPGLRAIDVSSDAYVDGGASTVQELSFTLATAIEYLRQLTDGGLAVDAAAKQIGFSFAVSGNFFMEIAKLRAARLLWSKVVVAAGGTSDAVAVAPSIHCRTARFNKTAWDPWVNMLRVTAECTAAVLGGAQSVSTLSFDAALGRPDELARRVARNTQVVLREESHLDAVADPAGGSWFVEELTDELAHAAWDAMRRIEGDGGMVQALASGRVVDAVDAVAESRQKSLATRKSAVVGVSEFPNASEERVSRQHLSDGEVERLVRAGLDQLDVSANRDVLLTLARLVNDTSRAPGALTEACVEAAQNGTDVYSIAAVLQHGQPDFHVEPVPQWRASGAWETLRNRSGKAAAPPVALLANLGAIPSHKARSTWTQNLLGAAGVESLGNDGFSDPESLAAAWRDAEASLAVVCGSDADYETMLEPAVRALKAAGCPLVLVAGRPGDRAAALRDAGVSDFVFVGADVLDVMGRVLDSVGVER